LAVDSDEEKVRADYAAGEPAPEPSNPEILPPLDPATAHNHTGGTIRWSGIPKVKPTPEPSAEPTNAEIVHFIETHPDLLIEMDFKGIWAIHLGANHKNTDRPTNITVEAGSFREAMRAAMAETDA
jgi:hypothetical protein